MGEVELVKDLLSLDQDVLPNEDGIIPSFGVEKVKSLHHYYGNPDQDTFQGASTYAVALMKCANDLLRLEYGGQKKHVTNQQYKLKEKYHIDENPVKEQVLSGGDNNKPERVKNIKRKS